MRQRPAVVNAAPFQYGERAPPEQLAPWVLSLWFFHSEATTPPEEPYTVWPDGCASIAWAHMPPAPMNLLCVGPRHTALHLPVIAGQRIWGLRLWPDTLGIVTGLDARTLRDHVGPAPGAIHDRFGSHIVQLPVSDDPDVIFPAIIGAMGRRLVNAPEPDARIRAAVRAIVAAKGEIAMADVAREAGLGLRHLQRRFPAITGLTLREYARVRRLREALAHRLSERRPGWSRIAAETGFVDHAHLTHEFVTLTGIRPSGASRQLERTAHDEVTP